MTRPCGKGGFAPARLSIARPYRLPIGTGQTAIILSLRTNPLACALFCRPIIDCVPDRRIGIQLTICAHTRKGHLPHMSNTAKPSQTSYSITTDGNFAPGPPTSIYLQLGILYGLIHGLFSEQTGQYAAVVGLVFPAGRFDGVEGTDWRALCVHMAIIHECFVFLIVHLANRIVRYPVHTTVC